MNSNRVFVIGIILFIVGILAILVLSYNGSGYKTIQYKCDENPYFRKPYTVISTAYDAQGKSHTTTTTHYEKVPMPDDLELVLCE